MTFGIFTSRRKAVEGAKPLFDFHPKPQFFMKSPIYRENIKLMMMMPLT